MSTRLTQLEAFHRQLKLVAQTGIPLKVGFPAADLEAELSKVLVQIKVNATGGTVDTALNEMLDSSSLPESYRAAAKAWLNDSSKTMALEIATANALGEQRVRSARRISEIQPCIIIVLAYGTLIVLCLTTLPILLLMLNDLRKEPGVAISILIWLRAWMWLWVPLVLLAMLSWIVVRWRFVAPIKSSVTGYQQLLSRSVLAQQVSVLAELSPSSSIEEATRQLPANLMGAPLLQWAMSSKNHAKQFRFASRCYSVLAQQSLKRFQNRYLLLFTLLVGGTLVALVSLCVFGPTVELLLHVATPRATMGQP